MAFKRGIDINELGTSVVAPVEATSGIPFVVGTTPVNLATAPVAANTPVLAFTYAEAVAAMGYSDDWAKFTACEAIYTHFVLYEMAPMIIVNVLDPTLTAHKTAVGPASVPVSNRVATLAVDGVLLSSLSVKSSDGATTYTAATDYTAAFNEVGQVVITTKSTGTIPANATALQVGYSKINPAGVTSTDVIGGVTAGGVYTGFELVNQVFPRFGVLPDILIAPGWSHIPAVAAVMKAKAGNINGNFKAEAITDLDPTQKYTDVAAWKSTNSYTGNLQADTYPKVTLGGKVYWLSSQLAGLIAKTDTENDGIPYVSPSNKALKIDGSVLADGTPLYLGMDQAAYLNSQGIITSLNLGTSGWRAWGNNTGAYPATTDPKDSFLPIRRMFNWVGNSIILTYVQRVDDPTNKRLITTVMDSLNIWLNGLTSSGALLGGRVEFNASENPVTDLMAGKLTFHLRITPPGPAQEISFLLEYDSSYLSALAAS